MFTYKRANGQIVSLSLDSVEYFECHKSANGFGEYITAHLKSGGVLSVDATFAMFYAAMEKHHDR